MYALLALILLMPAATRGLSARILIGVLSTAVALGGVYAVSESRRHVLIGVVLMVPPLAMEWLNATVSWTSESLLLVPSFYGLPFGIYVIYMVARYVFRAGRVTVDRLEGAVCIYLLLGYLWANAYVSLEHWMPGSFRFAIELGDAPGALFRHLTYFSYVTLTTLGYGDTVPVSNQAYSLAILESICGVLFMGILVARLAGMLETGGQGDEKCD
jgi:hypothetical protein